MISVVDRRRRDRIQPGRRLVVEQDARLERHRARDRDAPPLAAGQLRRHLVDVLGQADEPEHLLDAPVDLVERHLGFFVQLVADVLAHGQRVEQRAFLEDHAEIGAHRIISSSVSWSTRSPFTQITPASGLSRPVMIFRIVDLPEPLAPRMILVCPLISVKLTSFSTTLSSNASYTWSNMITGAPG